MKQKYINPCVDCKRKAKYQCVSCKQKYCYECTKMMDYECDCQSIPRLVKIE